jgi:hypothetical protein
MRLARVHGPDDVWLDAVGIPQAEAAKVMLTFAKAVA